MPDNTESRGDQYTFQELRGINSLAQLNNFINGLGSKKEKTIYGLFSDKNGMVGRVSQAELNDLVFKMRDDGIRPDLEGSIQFSGSNFQVSEIWDKVEELSIKNNEK